MIFPAALNKTSSLIIVVLPIQPVGLCLQYMYLPYYMRVASD